MYQILWNCRKFI